MMKQSVIVYCTLLLLLLLTRSSSYYSHISHSHTISHSRSSSSSTILLARAIIKGFNSDGKNMFNKQENMVSYLNDSMSTLVSVSRARYYSGTCDSTNPKPQMGTWVSDNDKQTALKVLSDVIISTESILGKFIIDAPNPLIIDIIPSSSTSSLYSITYFHNPSYASLPSRKHIAGTIIFYKALYGLGLMKSSIKDRVIAEDQFQGSFKSVRDFTNTNTNSIQEGTLLTRIGGPIRTIEYKSNSFELEGSPCPLGYIEVCLFPPETESDTELLVESDDRLITRLDPPQDQVFSLFSSYNQRQGKLLTIDSEIQSDEDKSTKYEDVKNKLSKKIGGLNTEIDDIVRRLLASRRLPPQTLQSLGLSHVRGLLLYGDPGTGKTLIAREIAKALNAREPKIVNGPEILDKFVGEAEKNIRELFRDADDEWDRLNYKSELHVIILDEIDAIAKRRGLMTGDGSGVRDSVVNQLLTKIDGVRERNNVLVIGMSNRIDLIDPALIRPGRLEVQIKIENPTRGGRIEILYIMLKPMILGNFIRLDEAKKFATKIAIATAGFTGADLAGVLRSASSFALNRYYGDDTEIKITWPDIEAGLKEMKKNKKVSKRKIISETLQYHFKRVFNQSKFKNDKYRTLEQILYDS